MKKILLSSFLVVSFTSYAMYSRIWNSPAPVLDRSTDLANPIRSQIKNNNTSYDVTPSKTQTSSVIKSTPKPVIVNTVVSEPTSGPTVVETPIVAPATPVYTAPVASTPAPTPTPAPIPTPAPAPVQTGRYKNGSYTGSVADASYGYVQVTAIISGGKLTDVKFLDYPRDAQKSLQKSMYSMPILISEAIAIQDSNVNTVSGASFTSQAYRESLGSALAQAK